MDKRVHVAVSGVNYSNRTIGVRAREWLGLNAAMKEVTLDLTLAQFTELVTRLKKDEPMTLVEYAITKMLIEEMQSTLREFDGDPFEDGALNDEEEPLDVALHFVSARVAEIDGCRIVYSEGQPVDMAASTDWLTLHLDRVDEYDHNRIIFEVRQVGCVLAAIEVSFVGDGDLGGYRILFNRSKMSSYDLMLNFTLSLNLADARSDGVGYDALFGVTKGRGTKAVIFFESNII